MSMMMMMMMMIRAVFDGRLGGGVEHPRENF